MKHRAEDRRQQTWRALQLFLLYRLTLVSTLSFAYFTGTGPSLLGNSSPALFSASLILYLGLVVSSGLLLHWRWPPADQQVQLTLFIDILIITFLMHASGGLTSGLGLLIAVSIAIGSLLLRGRLSLLFAALGSLAVLTEQVYSHLSDASLQSAYTLTGLLGTTFFAVALLAHGLSTRLRETEHLARQRSVDLANLAQLNEYIIQHMGTGVLVVDTNAHIRLLNETAKQHLGAGNIRPGASLNTALPELSKLLREWRADSANAPGEFRHLHGGRSLQPTFTPLGRNSDHGTLIFLEDSSRLAKQAQQMKLASLGRFTASIAHEIRNPLGAISHAGQLLAESPALEKSDRRLTEIIKSNSDRLNAIIETVLQLSRREQAHPQALPLQAWVQRFATESYRDGLLPAGTLDIHIEPADLEVQADPQHLRQILGNLCDNALKHAKQAARRLRIQIRGGLSATDANPLLRVCDNGPGIPPQHQQEIFEPFFTTGAKGTGLGLYIAKELCEINRITLEYEAEHSDGGCFRLEFLAWHSRNDP